MSTLEAMLGLPRSPVALEENPDSFRRRIRSALEQDSFYSIIAPKFFRLMDTHTFDGDLTIDIFRDTLKKGRLRTGEKYSYLGKTGPCQKKSELQEVAPWWDLSHPILVCGTSLRLDIKTDPTTEQGCDVLDGWANNPCGCGPNLIYCAPTDNENVVLRQAMVDEVVQTLKYVVVNHKPYKELFLMKDSVRSTYGEFWYARSALLNGADLTMPPVTATSGGDFQFRARTEDYGGGLLTTPYFLYSSQARRPTVSNLWSDLLCADWAATGVDPHMLVDLAKTRPDLRGSINTTLTETPGCQGCHVRLEYGAMALSTFADGYHGSRLNVTPEVQRTRFYVNGAKDLRGEGPATPLWLGQMITSQPEFLECAVKRSLAIAYQGSTPPRSVSEKLLKDFKENQDLGTLIENSILARAFGPSVLEQ